MLTCPIGHGLTYQNYGVQTCLQRRRLNYSSKLPQAAVPPSGSSTLQTGCRSKKMNATVQHTELLLRACVRCCATGPGGNGTQIFDAAVADRCDAPLGQAAQASRGALVPVRLRIGWKTVLRLRCVPSSTRKFGGATPGCADRAPVDGPWRHGTV